MIMPVKHSGNLSVNRNTNGNSSKKREEEQRFLQEFEGELEQEDVDDFLRQFELELQRKKRMKHNESVNTQSSVDEKQEMLQMRSVMQSKTAPAGSSATSEQTVSGDTQAAAQVDKQSFLKT